MQPAKDDKQRKRQAFVGVPQLREHHAMRQVGEQQQRQSDAQRAQGSRVDAEVSLHQPLHGAHYSGFGTCRDTAAKGE